MHLYAILLFFYLLNLQLYCNILGENEVRTLYSNILIVPSMQRHVIQVVCDSLLLNDFNDKWKTSQLEVCPSSLILVDFYHNCLCFTSATGQNVWMDFEICSPASWVASKRWPVRAEGGVARGEKRGGGGRKPKAEMSFVVGIFAQVESRITKYCIIPVTFLLRLRGQYRAEPTQICPLESRIYWHDHTRTFQVIRVAGCIIMIHGARWRFVHTEGSC